MYVYAKAQRLLVSATSCTQAACPPLQQLMDCEIHKSDSVCDLLRLLVRNTLADFPNPSTPLTRIMLPNVALDLSHSFRSSTRLSHATATHVIYSVGCNARDAQSMVYEHQPSIQDFGIVKAATLTMILPARPTLRKPAFSRSGDAVCSACDFVSSTRCWTSCRQYCI